MDDNNTQELWLPVVGYKGYYEVSSFGQVRSLGGRKGSRVCTLKQADTKGYSCVALCVNRTRRTRLVHHLVAEAFLPISVKLPEVNHIDGNKKNNRVENLEWTDRMGNMAHAFATGLVSNKGELHGRHKLSEADVRYIREPSNESTWHLSKRFDVSEQTIKDVRMHKSWKHIKESGEL